MISAQTLLRIEDEYKEQLQQKDNELAKATLEITRLNKILRQLACWYHEKVHHGDMQDKDYWGWVNTIIAQAEQQLDEKEE